MSWHFLMLFNNAGFRFACAWTRGFMRLPKQLLALLHSPWQKKAESSFECESKDRRVWGERLPGARLFLCSFDRKVACALLLRLPVVSYSANKGERHARSSASSGCRPGGSAPVSSSPAQPDDVWVMYRLPLRAATCLQKQLCIWISFIIHQRFI